MNEHHRVVGGSFPHVDGWHDLGHRLNRNPQLVLFLPHDGRLEFVNLHIVQLQVNEQQVVQSLAVSACPQQPAGHRRIHMSREAYQNRYIYPFG
jgi:lauroyl/myristoyl acyltransferase